MATSTLDKEVLDQEAADFYRYCIRLLNGNQVRYMVGGAYALARYTGIIRHTKDFDIFVLPADAPGILEILKGSGFRTELTFPHWLGKAFHGENFLDVIFSSGNGVATVDEDWFAHAVPDTILEEPVLLCPAEEIIWSKSFVCERERYDGADINHLIRACGPTLDWNRLLNRFGLHWRVLLSHVVLFGFAYPAERDKVPEWVIRELTQRLHEEAEEPAPDERVCQGTLISREQYLTDLRKWGYKDARLEQGTMTGRDVRHWTAAIEEKP